MAHGMGDDQGPPTTVIDAPRLLGGWEMGFASPVLMYVVVHHIRVPQVILSNSNHIIKLPHKYFKFISSLVINIFQFPVERIIARLLYQHMLSDPLA